MEQLSELSSLRQWLSSCRAKGETIGFVPTMGALHAGHLSLVEQARRDNVRVVVSIFVNPSQFGPQEDFSRYPRTLEQDRQILTAAGCDALFTPDAAEIYPAKFQTEVRLLPLGEILCGAFRPGHFAGVATVVTILFNLVQPDRAYFGLKDYQQLVIIRRLVRDLQMPVQVIGLPTKREEDGLAMSSRNRFLSPEERQRATALHRALQAARAAWQNGEREPQRLEAIALARLEQADISHVEYLTLCDADDLTPLLAESPTDPVMLIAVRIGSVRLIDNMLLTRLDG